MSRTKTRPAIDLPGESRRANFGEPQPILHFSDNGRRKMAIMTKLKSYRKRRTAGYPPKHIELLADDSTSDSFSSTERKEAFPAARKRRRDPVGQRLDARKPRLELWILLFVALFSICIIVFTYHLAVRLDPQQSNQQEVNSLFRSETRSRLRPLAKRPASLNELSKFSATAYHHNRPNTTDNSVSSDERHHPTPSHHHHHHQDKKKKKKEKHTKRRYSRLAPSPTSLYTIPKVVLPREVIPRERHSWNDPLPFFQASPSRRVVALPGIHPIAPSSTYTFKSRDIPQFPSPFSDSTQYYSVRDSSDPALATMELRVTESDDCRYMSDWQSTFFPTCNAMHEIDTAAAVSDSTSEDDVRLFGMKGYWRNAWRLDAMAGHQTLDERDTVVLKTLKINHRFEEAYYENNRVDAVVLERLTQSEHVINVFGFCGNSVVTEYADGKRLGELADKSKKTPLARLRIARDIAQGLADVHGIDGDASSFVHLDINPANVVSINGTLKLNDFNIGVLRQRNVTTGEICGIPAQYPNPQWRSPEEARREMNLTEKVDVFSLGHIFFRLICGHEPWHKLEPGGMPAKDVLSDKVARGVLPAIPVEILESTDPEIAAIRKAMLDCYTFDPLERPSAKTIALFLRDALAALE